MLSNMNETCLTPTPKQLCQVCVSSTVRYGIQILQIEDKTILVNNTKHTINYRVLLSEHAPSAPDQVMCTYTHISFNEQVFLTVNYPNLPHAAPHLPSSHMVSRTQVYGH